MEYNGWIVNVLRDIENFADLSGMKKTKLAVATAILHAEDESLGKTHENGAATIHQGSGNSPR